MSLETFLRDTPLAWVLDLDAQLRATDWAPFDPGPRPGRIPFHPRVLVGLIVCGMLRAQWSLRALETLAATDVGAWWRCGGLRPDHSTLGDFITTHAALLTEELFVRVTRDLARRLDLSADVVAGDGTVIEAAASRFRALREEAARAARERAVAAVTAAPEDPAAQARLEQAQDVVATIEERAAVRRSMSADTTTVTACATEPDAVVQPRKDGAMRPSDKPGVLAHPSGLLVGQVVEPSHESATILPMLCPHAAIFDELPTTTWLDSGDHDVATLQLFVDLGRDVLCPAGPPPRARVTAAPTSPKLLKHLFVDQPMTDTYRCPEGRTLEARERGHNHAGLAFRRYRGVACKDCPQRARCTTGRTGRILTRDEGDDLKEAMTQILQNPVAQARYRRRSALVEPVFAGLRERQGLRRFRRRGLRGVAVEFALHGLAYNLRKGQRLAARRRARRAVHSRGGPWCTPPRRLAPRACRRPSSTRRWGGSQRAVRGLALQ